MANYRGASYQHDVAIEMARQHDVFFYGPGFDCYAPSDRIGDVLAKTPWGHPDVICVGHAWLSDQPSDPLEIVPHVRLDGVKLPKVFILNKEYTRLADKLAYARQQKFQLLFTHHHAVADYKAATEVKAIYWPFAADGRKFFQRGLKRDVDLFFSGLLKNRHHDE